MYYILYLSSLCRRRRWSDPHYESYQYSNGFSCTVRVNGREYQSESILDTEVLAREAAAMRAYLFCRNFSLNDGAHVNSSAMATVGAPQPQTASIGASSMTGANRGYAIGNGNGYATGPLPGQGGMPMDNVSGRMVSSQGVIVVGHSQIGM
jgi:hypothetical protein